MIQEFSSIKSMKRCLEKGIGITICPDISIQTELAERKLVRLGCDDCDPETSVIMIWHSQKWRSPVLNQFLEISETVFSRP